MITSRVKFTTLDDESGGSSRLQATVTLRVQFEDQPEGDAREYRFKDRASLERAFAFVGLTPAMMTPLDLVGFWDVTDEQVAGVIDGRVRS